MPPAQDDERARQLEALRRYVAEIASKSAPRRRRRPSRSWLLLTGLLVTVALVAGVLVGAMVWSGGRPTRGDADAGASSAAQGPTTTVDLVASPACKTAVDRANATLASAVKLRGTLAELDGSLNDPANRRRPGRQVLERLRSSLRVGSGASARFDRALAAYRQVVDQCELWAP
jgi:hypothetical protein